MAYLVLWKEACAPLHGGGGGGGLCKYFSIAVAARLVGKSKDNVATVV